MQRIRAAARTDRYTRLLSRKNVDSNKSSPSVVLCVAPDGHGGHSTAAARGQRTVCCMGLISSLSSVNQWFVPLCHASKFTNSTDRLRSCSRAISASTRCTLFSPATGTHLCRMHARLHLCTLVTPLPLSLPLPLPSTGTGPRSARVCVQCRSADGVAFVLSTTRPLCSDTVRCHISLVACCMPYVACCMLRVNALRVRVLL